MRYLSLFFLLLTFSACQQEKQPTAEFQGQAIHGLASAIRMASDSIEVLVNDYFVDTTSIDSISISKGYTAALLEGKIRINSLENAPQAAVLSCWVKQQAYQLLVLKSNKKRVKIQYASDKAKKVEIAGEMNNWGPQKLLTDGSGNWEIEFKLEDGKYQYQLIVDEVWQLDPNNAMDVDNGNGGRNSLLQIGKPFEKGPSPLKVSIENQQISLDFEAYQQPPIVFWENFQLKASNNSPYQFEIPAAASSKARSHLRGWAVNTEGQISDFLIPLKNGKAISDPKDLNRQDKHSAVLYFMLVDRFHNGNKAIDDPDKDPEVHEKANYFGGDLEGIRQKLEEGYFEDLGINTIWLSPITQNPLHAEVEYPAPHRKYSGYHGYWPISATKIDHRFGNSEDLKALVSLAHKKEMNVILDYVSNHVHQENPIIQQHPDWATILDLPDGRKNIRIWDEHRLTTWFDTFLPTLDFSKEEVIDLMTDSALFMLATYDLDGFRHDATKHIPEAFWRTLTRKIKKEVKKPVYQIGETFGSRELIGSYVNSGQMDGQFDFNLYFDLRSVLAGETGSFHKLNESLHASMAMYGTNSLMGNITGNHDIARFISYAGKGLSFNENDREAGWSRDIQVEDSIGYRKLELLTAFLMTAPGIPVIYYGDEIGMPGAGDPDNRRPMKFQQLSEQEQKVRNRCKQLINTRKTNMALMYGDFKTCYVDDKTFAYQRTYLGQQTLVILHNDKQEKSIRIGEKEYRLAPYSYQIH